MYRLLQALDLILFICISVLKQMSWILLVPHSVPENEDKLAIADTHAIGGDKGLFIPRRPLSRQMDAIASMNSMPALRPTGGGNYQ
jgi:hypothetical protein